MYHIQLAVLISSLVLLSRATAASWETGDVSVIDPLVAQINSWGPVRPAVSDSFTAPFYTTGEFPAIGTTHVLKKRIPFVTSAMPELPLTAYFTPAMTSSPFQLTRGSIGFTGSSFTPLRSQILNAAAFPVTNYRVSPVSFVNRLNMDDLRSSLKPVLSGVKSSKGAPVRPAASSSTSSTGSTVTVGSAPSAPTVSSFTKAPVTSSAPVTKVIKTIPTISVSAIEEALVTELTPVVTSLVSDVTDSFLNSVVHEVSTPIVKTVSHQLATVVHSALTSYVPAVSRSVPVVSIGSFLPTTASSLSVNRLQAVPKRVTTVSKVAPAIVHALPTLTAVAEAFQKSPVLTNEGAVPVGSIATRSSASRGVTVSEMVSPTQLKSILSPIIANLRSQIPIIISQIRTPLIESAVIPAVKTIHHPQSVISHIQY